MAIRLVTHVRGRFAWRPRHPAAVSLIFPRRVSKESPAGARLCPNHDSTRPRRTAALKGKRDALTAELAETDPKLGDQLVDILTRIKAVDEEIARLGGAGGAGIAKELRLPGSGGSREWPPPRPFDPAWFTPFRSIAATRSTGEKSKKKPPAVATCGL